ncbi:MAG: zinc ribbon domain-containing protein [Candidatus Odinarchaeota archaeon]
MAEIGFVPLSSQLGVPGTSYRLQLGEINEKWAVRLLKGHDVIDSYVFKDEDVQGDFPNQNVIVGWVLRTVAIPNINPHQIMKTVQALVKQSIKNKEEKKMKPQISEAKTVELSSIPQSELKRSQVQGWVKTEERGTSANIEEERRQAFRETVIARKAEVQSSMPTSTVKTTRQLPTIPKEGISVQAHKSSEGGFCPFCGKDLNFKYCPYCGKPLPH